MEHNSRDLVTLDRSAPIPDHDLDWIWPASDTFTDDSISPRISQTCSELGSKRIRLIRILPGGLSDAIECETRVCALTQAGEYTALSYTWGSPVTRCHIIVDRQPRQIATNLWRFLRQARQIPLRYSGWLWIDALSIHQSDPWEKLEQVKIISDIFKGAKRSVVWLGPSYGDSDKALRALTTIMSTRSYRSLRSLYAPPLGPAILDICERAYWRRLWVFQELRCSQTIDLMCGDRHVNFSYLKQFLLLENEDERLEVHCKVRMHESAAAQMVRLTRVHLDTSLQSMLRETQHLRCADPRDKVYAILNTVRSGHQDIEPDYTMSLPILINKVLRNTLGAIEPDSITTVSSRCSHLAKQIGVNATSIFGEVLVFAGRVMECKTPYGEPALGASDPHNVTPLMVLEHVIISMGSPHFYQYEEAETLVGEVHRWCKEHNHGKIGALVRQTLDNRRWYLEYWRRNHEYLMQSTAQCIGTRGRPIDWQFLDGKQRLIWFFDRLVFLFDDFVESQPGDSLAVWPSLDTSSRYGYNYNYNCF